MLRATEVRSVELKGGNCDGPHKIDTKEDRVLEAFFVGRLSRISRSRSYFINGVDATRTWASLSANVSGRSPFQSPSLRHYDSFS
jgi:hypothetical protein